MSRPSDAARIPGSPYSDALRYGERLNALIRVLTWEEANHRFGGCAWCERGEVVCEAMPCFRLATPHGQLDYCRDHIDYAIASLPTEWIEGWAWCEPLTIGEGPDDIPF